MKKFQPNLQGIILPKKADLVYARKTPKFPSKAAYTLLEIASDLILGGSVIYDPFCGNGTILITAALNFSDFFPFLYGSDINSEAVEATRINLVCSAGLSEEKINSQVVQRDATSDFPREIIDIPIVVTDPPFGRRCPLKQGDLEASFNNFHDNLVKNVVFCFDDKTPLPRELKDKYQIKKVYQNWDRTFYVAQAR